MTETAAYSLQELARILELQLDGSPETLITGIATLEKAGPGQLAFYHNPRFYPGLAQTRASAVILRPEHAAACPVATLQSSNPYAAYAKASHLFARPLNIMPGIHPTASIDASAVIDASAMVQANVVIGADSQIGAHVRVGANSVIGRGCTVGEHSCLHANVTLYDDVSIGSRVIVHAAAVLGGDGFGYAQDGGHHHKIAQLGGVRIGNNVEIGASTCIDRGALDDTVIEAGVKIDNQVQIAHNVRVGANTVICGCSAIAGSSVIGKNCIIAGAVGIINHVSICDGVTVTAMSLVNHSITVPGVYSSGTGLSDTASWRKNIVRFRQLDELWKRLLRLEKKSR